MKKYNQLFKSVTLLFAILCFSNINATEIKSISDLPEGVSIHLLDNGMQVLLIENPALPMIGANVVVKVGSAYESFATSGMSHMLEHLLFNGTTTRSQKQFYDDTDMIGGYNNANTSEFYTNYMMVTPSEHIKVGMELQADMLYNSILPEEKFQKEKGIVLEEISKSLANPREQLERNILSIMYPGHAMSLPTLGTYTTIESLKREDVVTFFNNYYVPNNMILSVIGNFKSPEMLSSIKEIYGKAEPGKVEYETNPQWKTGFQPPSKIHNSAQDIFHRFYDGSDVQFQMFFPLPQVEQDQYYQLIEIILDRKKTEIESALKEKFSGKIKGLSLETFSSIFASFLKVTISLKEKTDYNDLSELVSQHISKLNFSFSKKEINSETAKAKTNFLKNIEKPHMFGIFNANIFAVHGIEAVLSSYSGIPISKAASELKSTKVKEPGMIIIQNPSPKQKEEVSEAIIQKLFQDKDSGKTLVAVQNKASNLLAVHYLFKHKAPMEKKYGKNASKILHDCFGQRLKSEKNREKSSMFGFSFKVNDNPYFPMDNIYLHPDFGYIRAECSGDDIPAAISFLNGQMKNYVPTKDEFNKAAGKFKYSNPMMGRNKAKEIFDETYKSAVYEDNEYMYERDTLSYEKLLAFSNEYFQPENMIISAVSSASPEQINSSFSEYTSKPIKEEHSAYSREIKLQNKPVTIEKKGEGKRSYLFWGFAIQIEPADKAALTALSLVLKDEIIFDIREKQGMAYHMSAGIELTENRALFYINQGTRPQNVDKLTPQYPGFFAAEKIAKLTEKDIQKSINMYLGRMMFRRLSSINQAYYLAHSLYFHNDLNYDKDFLKKLKNVKLKEVVDVAEKYMHVKNPALIIVR